MRLTERIGVTGVSPGVVEMVSPLGDPTSSHFRDIRWTLVHARRISYRLRPEGL